MQVSRDAFHDFFAYSIKNNNKALFLLRVLVLYLDALHDVFAHNIKTIINSSRVRVQEVEMCRLKRLRLEDAEDKPMECATEGIASKEGAVDEEGRGEAKATAEVAVEDMDTEEARSPRARPPPKVMLMLLVG